uniref:Uncharacterized protein n=1 Tax=Tanacetum cinerariifolium TaxID=118510 RepID=A0A6L2J377_TANCI|nr:hypothetical protein [Tanacetum cinerariifolium]
MMMMNMDDSIDTKLHNGSIIYNNNAQFGYNESLDNSVPVSRKRSRDNNSYSNSQTMFLGQDIMMFSSQINQRQHFEIDQFIKHHSENVRLEIEAKRRKNSRTLIAALEEGLQHQLRAKEDEITKMTKLNHALEEKVKTMCLENQIWRELAQTNEATANALRNNLRHVLDYKLGDDKDAESCCESSKTTIPNPVLTAAMLLNNSCLALIKLSVVHHLDDEMLGFEIRIDHTFVVTVCDFHHMVEMCYCHIDRMAAMGG